MGAGGSRNYRSHEEQQRYEYECAERARKREARRKEERERKEACKKERDEWVRVHGIGEREKKWWNTGPIWPLYKWWKERSAWKKEEEKRRKTGRLDSEGVRLLKQHND